MAGSPRGMKVVSQTQTTDKLFIGQIFSFLQADVYKNTFRKLQNFLQKNIYHVQLPSPHA